jgi:hypothetical protein
MASRVPMKRLMDTSLLMTGRPGAWDRDAEQVAQCYEMAVYRACARLMITFEEVEHLLMLMTRAQSFQQ